MPDNRHLREDTLRHFTVVIGTALVVVAGTAYAQTPDPNLARNIAAGCANCHGTNGVSQGGTPSLAGMPRQELVARMKEYKAGTRPATIMIQLAKGYSDEQIELIAGWFAAQPAK